MTDQPNDGDLPGFIRHPLDQKHCVFTRHLPPELVVYGGEFDMFWQSHPSVPPEIQVGRRHLLAPRWHAAYGAGYPGRVATTAPVPPAVLPLLSWCRGFIDMRLNGILVNWYDSELGHYIGKHRDSTTEMVVGSPIVTISFGQQRTFRLRPWPRKNGDQYHDIEASHGLVIIIPYTTNLAFTHEVPKCAPAGRRISVTFRAFVAAQ